MDQFATQTCTAFDDGRCVATGSLIQVAEKVKEAVDRDPNTSILLFDDATGEQVELDLRGTTEDVLKRLPQPVENDPPKPRRPGRPKLGVVSREVTLLPRHWEWLNSQPGGASVALRKVVEEARRVNSDKDRIRSSQEAAYRFMSAMAGDLAGFEEATRALFKADGESFDRLIAAWPSDMRNYARKLAAVVFEVNVRPDVCMPARDEESA